MALLAWKKLNSSVLAKMCKGAILSARVYADTQGFKCPCGGVFSNRVPHTDEKTVKCPRCITELDFDSPVLMFARISKVESLFGFPVVIDNTMPKDEIRIGNVTIKGLGHEQNPYTLTDE